MQPSFGKIQADKIEKKLHSIVTKTLTIVYAQLTPRREREKKKGNFFSQAIYCIALIYYVSNAFTTVVSFANYQHTDCKIMEIRMVTSIGIPVCYYATFVDTHLRFLPVIVRVCYESDIALSSRCKSFSHSFNHSLILMIF